MGYTLVLPNAFFKKWADLSSPCLRQQAQQKGGFVQRRDLYKDEL